MLAPGLAGKKMPDAKLPPQMRIRKDAGVYRGNNRYILLPRIPQRIGKNRIMLYPGIDARLIHIIYYYMYLALCGDCFPNLL